MLPSKAVARRKVQTRQLSFGRTSCRLSRRDDSLCKLVGTPPLFPTTGEGFSRKKSQRFVFSRQVYGDKGSDEHKENLGGSFKGV